MNKMLTLAHILSIMGKYSVIDQPNDVMLNLAKRFRQLRRENKLSRTEFSQRCGVSESSIKRFELTGRISLESLLKAAHLLDKLSDFEAIFSGQEKNDKVERLFSDKTKRK